MLHAILMSSAATPSQSLPALPLQHTVRVLEVCISRASCTRIGALNRFQFERSQYIAPRGRSF